MVPCWKIEQWNTMIVYVLIFIDEVGVLILVILFSGNEASYQWPQNRADKAADTKDDI